MWRSKENLTKGLHSICIAYVLLIVCNTDGWLSGRMDRRWLMDGCMYEGRTAGCPPLHLHYCRVLNLFHSMRKKQKQIWTSSPLLCSKLNPSPPLGSQTDVSTTLQCSPTASLCQTSAEAEKTVLLITCLILSLSFPGAHKNTTQRFVALFFGECLITSNPAREEAGFQQLSEALGLARPPLRSPGGAKG